MSKTIRENELLHANRFYRKLNPKRCGTRTENAVKRARNMYVCSFCLIRVWMTNCELMKMRWKYKFIDYVIRPNKRRLVPNRQNAHLCTFASYFYVVASTNAGSNTLLTFSAHNHNQNNLDFEPTTNSITTFRRNHFRRTEKCQIPSTHCRMSHTYHSSL